MGLVHSVSILLLVLTASAQCQQTAGDWVDKGNALGIQGNYDEAIKAYDDAIKLDPNYAAAWSNKGIALRNLGQVR